jgi:hypothetical protein
VFFGLRALLPCAEILRARAARFVAGALVERLPCLSICLFKTQIPRSSEFMCCEFTEENKCLKSNLYSEPITALIVSSTSGVSGTKSINFLNKNTIIVAILWLKLPSNCIGTVNESHRSKSFTIPFSFDCNSGRF